MTIETFLAEQNLTASAFAKKAGVAVSTVTRILRRERRPRMDIVMRLVTASDGRLKADDFLPHPETPQ